MDYVRLGSSGLQVSSLCLGMMSYGDPQWRAWVLDGRQAEPIVRQAVEHGIIFFDTANVYSNGLSEEITGRLLSKFFPRRDDYVLATKVNSRVGPGPNDLGLSRKHILRAVDDSLRRLGTDYVDLYQIHRWNNETPIHETMEVLHDLVRAGKVRYLGASSMFAWQFTKAQHTAERHGWTQFVSMQNHYNLIYREEEREMIPLCVDQGVGLIPWSPLARGFLSGNRRKDGWGDSTRSKSDTYGQAMYYRDEDFMVADHAVEIAKEHGVTGSQIALAWMLNKPHISSPIIGATKMDHLEQAVAALDIQLSEDEVKRLEEPYKPHPILGHS